MTENTTPYSGSTREFTEADWMMFGGAESWDSDNQPYLRELKNGWILIPDGRITRRLRKRQGPPHLRIR